MMRIAYVINSVEGGGAAAPVPAICNLLRRHGAEIIVLALTGRDRRGLPAMEKAGLEVRVRDGGEADHVDALRWLERELSNWRADVIWTSLTRATLLGQIIGQRLDRLVVSWQHAAYLRPLNRTLLRIRNLASALWLADSDCVAALTHDRLGVPAERLMTWPLFSVDREAPRAKPWQPGEPVRIGSLGRLHPVKGFDILIEALARLKAQASGPLAPFELHIAGEGEQRAALEALIRRHGLSNVSLVGFANNPRGFLAGLHLYVQPSRSEGLCIALHEAMQAGLPTIGSAAGEMPYTIRHRRTGMIVPTENAEALAAALAEYLREPQRLHACGVAARARVIDKLSPEAFEANGAAVFNRISALLRTYHSSARYEELEPWVF